MGIIHQHGVEFVSFQLLHEAKKWKRSYMECKYSVIPQLTLSQYHALFLDKSVPRTLIDRKKISFWIWSKVVCLWLLMRPSTILYLDMPCS